MIENSRKTVRDYSSLDCLLPDLENLIDEHIVMLEEFKSRCKSASSFRTLGTCKISLEVQVIGYGGEENGYRLEQQDVVKELA